MAETVETPNEQTETPPIAPEKGALSELKTAIEVGIQQVKDFAGSDEDRQKIYQEFENQILAMAEQSTGRTFENLDQAREHLGTVLSVRYQIDELRKKYPMLNEALQQASDGLDTATNYIQQQASDLAETAEKVASPIGAFFSGTKSVIGGIAGFIALKFGGPFRWSKEKIGAFTDRVSQRSSYAWNALLAGLSQESAGPLLSKIPGMSSLRSALRWVVGAWNPLIIEQAREKLAVMNTEEGVTLGIAKANKDSLIQVSMQMDTVTEELTGKMRQLYQRYVQNYKPAAGGSPADSLTAFTSKIVAGYVRAHLSEIIGGSSQESLPKVDFARVLQYAEAESLYKELLVSAPKPVPAQTASSSVAAVPAASPQNAERNLMQTTTLFGTNVTFLPDRVRIGSAEWLMHDGNDQSINITTATMVDRLDATMRLNFSRAGTVETVDLTAPEWQGLFNTMKSDAANTAELKKNAIAVLRFSRVQPSPVASPSVPPTPVSKKAA